MTTNNTDQQPKAVPDAGKDSEEVVVPRAMPAGVWDAVTKLTETTPVLRGIFGHTLLQVLYSKIVEAAAMEPDEQITHKCCCATAAQDAPHGLKVVLLSDALRAVASTPPPAVAAEPSREEFEAWYLAEVNSEADLSMAEFCEGQAYEDDCVLSAWTAWREQHRRYTSPPAPAASAKGDEV